VEPGRPALPGFGIDPGAAPPAERTADDLVKVHLVADTTRIAPGQTFHLAVVFDIAPHWHIYWINAGDSGAPTEVEVAAPDGFRVGPVLFPRPRAFREPDGDTFGYEEQVALFVPVTAPATLDATTTGAFEFTADVFFFVCSDVCLIGETTRSIRLPVADAAADPPGAGGPAGFDRLARHRRQVPRPLESQWGAAARVTDETLSITGPAFGAREASLFPLKMPGVQIGATRIRIEGGRFEITAPLLIRPQNAGGRPMMIGGVVALGGSRDGPSFHFKVPVVAGKSAADAKSQERSR